MMKKPVIGILPTSNYMLTNDTFQDTYRYGNNYINKIVENGGIPLLIPYLNDEVIWDCLKECDGLILPGGTRVLESNLKIVDYFYKNHKPILGICLGMQTLAVYSCLLDKVAFQTHSGIEKQDLLKLVDVYDVLKKVEDDSHCPYEVTREHNDILAHKNIVLEDSKLYGILKQKEIMVNSLHHYKVTKIGQQFKINMKSKDGVIEGLESSDENFVVGVQFHPEVLANYDIIFRTFINKCQEKSKVVK